MPACLWKCGALGPFYWITDWFLCFVIVITKQYYLIAFQDVIGPALVVRWCAFGYISAEVFENIYLVYNYDIMSNLRCKFYLSCALLGLVMWYFTREHVENVGDVETEEGTKTLVTQIV